MHDYLYFMSKEHLSKITQLVLAKSGFEPVLLPKSPQIYLLYCTASPKIRKVVKIIGKTLKLLSPGREK